MKSTTAGSTINALRCIFGRYGLPEQVVSDNGPPFQSVEYEDFLKQNGIQRMLVSPYHPASNGQAERFVQTFKNYLKTSMQRSVLFTPANPEFPTELPRDAA
jgi:transposase InsO family protein